MIDFSSLLASYQRRSLALSLPTAREWQRIEAFLGLALPDAFKDFYCQTAAVFFEGDLPSLYGTGSEGPEWEQLLTREWKLGLPRDLVPFCGAGNGDFHCFRFTSNNTYPHEVVYWFHDLPAGAPGNPEALTLSFEAWIEGYVADRF